MTPHDLTFFRKFFLVVVATLVSTDVARPRWRLEGRERAKLEEACPLFTSSATMKPLLVITPDSAVLLVLYNERTPFLRDRKPRVDRRWGSMPESSDLVAALRALPNQITPAGAHYASKKSTAVGAGYHAIQSFYHTGEYFKCAYAPYATRDAAESMHRATVAREARKWEERVDTMLNGFLTKYVGAYRVRSCASHP